MYYRTFILFLILTCIGACQKKDKIDLEIKEHQEALLDMSDEFNLSSLIGTYTLSGIDYKTESGKNVRTINRRSEGQLTLTDSTYRISYHFLTSAGIEFAFEEEGIFSIISYHERQVDNRTGITPYGSTYHFAAIDKYVGIQFSPFNGRIRMDTLKIGPGALKDINRLIFYDHAPVQAGQLRLKWSKVKEP